MSTPIDFKRLGLTIARLLAVYLAVLVVSALLTPYFWDFLHSRGGQFTFERIFDRLRYLGLLCFLPLLWSWSGLKSFRELGWGQSRLALILFALGALSVVGVGLWVGTDGFEPPKFDKALAVLGRGFATALVVAFIEELVFRGVFQRILVGAGGVVAGVALSAVCFSFLHGRPEAELMRLHHGVPQAWELAVKYVTAWPGDFPAGAFVNLALLGGVLGAMYIRGGSLLLPMAFHAGIVAAAIPVNSWMKHFGPREALYLVSQPQVGAVLLVWLVVICAWPKKKGA